MQYNIFKVIDKTSLISEMLETGYLSSNKIIKSGDYELKLYFNKRENSTISWRSILTKFDVNITVDKDNLKGILLADNGTDVYAITYGLSSPLVQKYCDSEFPMNVAKRVEVSKVKRKASKIMNGSTNSLVRTLTNSDVIVVDKGESVVNLELIPEEKENIGKCIGIGKSVRVNLDKQVDSIDEIIIILENICERPEKRPIPLFLKLKKQELEAEILSYLSEIFIERIDDANFTLEEMNILGSSIFFDDCFKTELSFKNIREEIPFLNTYYVKEFISKHNIDKAEVYKHLKIKYISDEGYYFVKSFYQVITYDFEYRDDKYVLYDGEIYYYNKDFLNNIKDGLKHITLIKYNEEDDFSEEWYKKFLKDNNFADVNDKDKKGKTILYREQAINKVLSEKSGYVNLDRNLVNICKGENYKIEIADLAKENDVLYAVKVGTPRDFCYAIDQSNLTLDTFISNSYDNDEMINKYKNVDYIGLWLYVTGKNNFYDEKNNINFQSFQSIMFLNKLTEWSNKVLAANKKPIIRINYYK